MDKKSKHIPIGKHNQLDINNDPTLINYLALAACILDENPGSTDYYLQGLFDEDESFKRRYEIEEIRAGGGRTELDEERRVRMAIKNGKCKRIKSGRPCKAIHINTGKEYTYESLKDLANDLGINYNSMRQIFTKRKSNEIEFKGYKLIKNI